jgi:ribonuclease HI
MTDNKVGMRACIRVEKRNFIVTMTTNKEGVMTSSEAEAWSLNQGIPWRVSLGYHKIYLEMDCKIVVDDVNNMKHNQSKYSPIIHDCRTLLSNYNNFIVVFTSRGDNEPNQLEKSLRLDSTIDSLNIVYEPNEPNLS